MKVLASLLGKKKATPSLLMNCSVTNSLREGSSRSGTARSSSAGFGMVMAGRGGFGTFCGFQLAASVSSRGIIGTEANTRLKENRIH